MVRPTSGPSTSKQRFGRALCRSAGSLAWSFAGGSIVRTLGNLVAFVSLPCSSLGGVHGIPKVHYKGRQADYYIMVRASYAQAPIIMLVCRFACQCFPEDSLSQEHS